MPINPTVEEISLREVLLPAVIKILLDGQGFSCHHLPQTSLVVCLASSLCPFVPLNSFFLINYNAFQRPDNSMPSHLSA